MTMFEFARADIKELRMDGELVSGFTAKLYVDQNGAKDNNAMTISYDFSDVDMAEISAGYTTAEQVVIEVVKKESDALVAYLQTTTEGYTEDANGNLTKKAPKRQPKPNPETELGSAVIDIQDLESGTIREKPKVA